MTAAPTTSLVLIGVGGAASTAVRGVRRAYGGNLRAIAVDTDASTGAGGEIDFALLGGNRLAGRGAGGQPGAVRAAFLDDPAFLDSRLDGVRTAVVVSCLGGGTSDGATAELLKHLHSLGIVSLVFATLPFSFEGDERMREAKAALGPMAAHADALATVPLDRLVADADTDNFQAALSRATDTIASGVTLLWRILEKPGYIKLDAERLRNIIHGSGTVRFAAVTAMGDGRTENILAHFKNSPLLTSSPAARPIRKILLGILAGDDLRLSEVAVLANGTRSSFGPDATFELGTVNDEATFSGRLAAVILLFEESATSSGGVQGGIGQRRRTLSAAERALAGADRFGCAEKTYWNDEDLDIPTFLRRNLTLEK
jgi:cell division protein FtsZ